MRQKKVEQVRPGPDLNFRQLKRLMVLLGPNTRAEQLTVVRQGMARIHAHGWLRRKKK